MTHFSKVQAYLTDLGFSPTKVDDAEELVIINAPEEGISNLIIDCEDPILVIEQLIFEHRGNNSDMFKRLLQMNRELVHGAFVLDESGEKVIYRDTLQLENLDLNELEASIKALSLALAEHSNELIQFATSN